MNINQLPLETYSQTELDQLLHELLSSTIEYNQVENIKLIFKRWYQLPVESSQLDHLTRFMCLEQDSKLRLLVARTMDKTFNEYIMDLINYDSLPFTLIGAENLADIFGDADWSFLLDYTVVNEMDKGYTNKLIKSWIEGKIVVVAPKPLYMIDTKVSIPVISGDRIQLNFNENLFKLFGPANSALNEDLSGNSPCQIYGGHRMFLCKEFEVPNLEGEDMDDFDIHYHDYQGHWYTGSCDACFKTIQRKRYAVRLPIWNGGWIGCYCSWSCVKSTLLPAETIVKELVEIFEEQCLRIGITE